MPQTNVNIDNFQRSLKAAIQKRHALAVQAVAEFGQLILADAKELCPVAQFQESIDAPPPGTLKESGFVSAAVVNGGRITVTVGFSAPFAAIVHERLDVHHAQGEAKYLETPMRQRGPQLPAFVAQRMK